MSDTFQITFQNVATGATFSLTEHGAIPNIAVAELGLDPAQFEAVAAQEVVYDDDGPQLTGEVIHLPL